LIFGKKFSGCTFEADAKPLYALSIYSLELADAERLLMIVGLLFKINRTNESLLLGSLHKQLTILKRIMNFFLKVGFENLCSKPLQSVERKEIIKIDLQKLNLELSTQDLANASRKKRSQIGT
jgi:hypothetical protein